MVKREVVKIGNLRELPFELHITDDYEISEFLTVDGCERILLSPSKCYLNDDVVQLEAVIEEIVRRYNEYRVPRLFQIHHQDKKDFSSEMVAQKEIANKEEMDKWCEEIAQIHPLPEGFQWMVCNENSEHFVMATTP